MAEKIIIIYGFYMEIRFSHPTRQVLSKQDKSSDNSDISPCTVSVALRLVQMLYQSLPTAERLVVVR